MNRARGETNVTLGGETFRCAMTLGAMARIEGRTGKSMARVLDEFSADVSIASVLAILEETCLDVEQRNMIADMTADIVELSEAVMTILKASGLLQESEGKRKPGK
jgi:hypothetical protein